MAAVFVFWIAPASTSQSKAEIITLFDASQGNLPSDQIWLQYSSFKGEGSQTSVSTGVRLKSDLDAGTGYSNHELSSTPQNPKLVNPNFPDLDRVRGFSLSFSLQITSETHTRDDRAGFSVTLLGNDGRGIELGFWKDQIFAQSDLPLFQAAESTSIDTTVAARNYVISIFDDGYSLQVDGNDLLGGRLRDYSTFDGVPYTLRNYLFLGDNTTSGGIDATLGDVVLNSNLTAIPEPSFLPLLLGAVVFRCYRLRRPIRKG